MSTLLTARFWVAAIERAIKTWAQSIAALLVGDGTNIITVDWLQILAVSGTAAVSLLTSVASAGIGPHGPSLADETIVEPLQPLTLTGPDTYTRGIDADPLDPDEVVG